jgi:hypothetical protein
MVTPTLIITGTAHRTVILKLLPKFQAIIFTFDKLWQPQTCFIIKVKVKKSRNGPGVAQRVPGGLGSQISMIFGT